MFLVQFFFKSESTFKSAVKFTYDEGFLTRDGNDPLMVLDKGHT